METTTVFEIKSQTQLDEAFGVAEVQMGKFYWKSQTLLQVEMVCWKWINVQN